MLPRRAALLLAVPVVLVLIGYVLYPSAETFVVGLRPSNLAAAFSSLRSANTRALVNSVTISLLTVLGAGVLGTGLAYLFFRYAFPLRRTLMALAALPLALPPLVGVLAFLFLYGESGILPRLLQRAFSLDAPPFSFDGLWAVWLVHVYTLYVYFYLFVTASLQGLDGNLLLASADLGASSSVTLRRVILPILRPALIGAALLVFMVSMASFTAPLLFAGTEPFLTVQIYNYKLNGNLELSSTVSAVLTAICLVFLLMIEWDGRRTLRAAAKGTASVPLPVRSGLARLIAFGGAVLLLVLLILPVATIVLISFAEEGGWTVQTLPARYTLENYTALFGDPFFFEPIRNSLVMAALATAGNVLFGLAAALLIVKAKIRGRSFVRVATALPFAIPGTVLALNFIVAFNKPTLFGFGQVLVGTFGILPLAYFVRNIPLVVRSTKAALEGYDDRLTEASEDLGASYGATFRRVMLPLIAPGILAGTLLAFVTALGEFVSSIMLYTPLSRPISIEILSQLRIFELGRAAAYSVLLMLLIGATTLLVRRLGGSPAGTERGA